MLPRAPERLNAPDAHIAQHPLLRDLDGDILLQLRQRSRVRHAPARSLVIREGDPAEQALLISSGSVRQIATAGDYDELTTLILRAPALVGAAECLLGRPHAGAIETLERTTLVEIPAGVWRAVLSQSPALVERTLRDTAALLCMSLARQSALAFCAVHTRVAHALVSLVEAYGVPVHGGLRIRLPFSRDLLASLLGLNRRSVARGLKWWFDRGAIARAGRNLVVRDLACLRQSGRVRMVHTSGSPQNPWLRPLAHDFNAHRLYA